jgi:glycolate oxidase FAD binding subunit
MPPLRPADENELRDAIADAAAAGRRLRLHGADTKSAIGHPAPHDASPLDLSDLSGIVAYEPEELVLTLRAGTPMAEVEALVGNARQMLAFEPMDLGPVLGLQPGLGTIGSTVACNLAGPRRPTAGAARDHMLGIRAVSGRGEIFKAGGRVVKNVTGYDLPRALTGSWGTLAAFSEITLKVLPRPETAETILILGLDDDTAARAMSAAVGSPYDVSAAAHLPAEISGSLAAVASARNAVTAIRLEGVPPSIRHRRAVLEGLLRPFGELGALDAAGSAALWAGVRDVEPFAASGKPLWRVSVAPMAGPKIGAFAARNEAWHFYDWAGGLVWVEMAGDPLPSQADSLRAAIAEAGGGHATLIRAGEEMRGAVSVFHPLDTVTAALVGRLKTAFDPVGVLNPGRMYR